MQTQPEFNFESNLPTSPPHDRPPDGLSSWHQERELAARELARRLGLPVGHQAEVRLKDGVILRGRLRAGEVIFSLETFSRGKLALEIDGIVFAYSEIESCVRLD